MQKLTVALLCLLSAGKRLLRDHVLASQPQDQALAALLLAGDPKLGFVASSSHARPRRFEERRGDWYNHIQKPSPIWAASRVGRASVPKCQLFKDKTRGSAILDSKTKERLLVEWLTENGVYMANGDAWGKAPHPVRVEGETMEDFESSGRGLLARREILFGQTVLEIPAKIAMTKTRAQEVLGKDIIPDGEPPEDPEGMGKFIAVAVLLMHERAIGDKSFWKPYIDILPTIEEVGASFTWSEEDLALLEGSLVVETSRSLKAKVIREYNNLVDTTFSRFPEYFPLEVYTYELFEWAMTNLFSRSFRLTDIGGVAMVPYADLLNHTPYSKMFLETRQMAFSNDFQLQLQSDRPHAVGDQVLLSYGQKSNSELLLQYGFVVDRNIFDEVEIGVSLPDDDPRYEEKKAFLEEQGLKAAMSFPMLIDRTSFELMQYLRLLCVDEDDGPLKDLAYNDIISDENEQQVLEILIDGCQTALNAYPQTEAEDEAMMRNSRLFASLPRNARMAIKLRRNEKRILKRTISYCELGLQKMAEAY